DAPADATVFTFASPPVRMQFAFVATCFVTCALGAAVVIGIGLDAYCNERRRSDGTVFGCLFGLAVIAAIAFVVYREVKRIRLAGDREVCLEVNEKTLLAWSPQQWGLEPRSLAIEAIRSISAHSAGSV